MAWSLRTQTLMMRSHATKILSASLFLVLNAAGVQAQYARVEVESNPKAVKAKPYLDTKFGTTTEINPGGPVDQYIVAVASDGSNRLKRYRANPIYAEAPVRIHSLPDGSKVYEFFDTLTPDRSYGSSFVHMSADNHYISGSRARVTLQPISTIEVQKSIEFAGLNAPKLFKDITQGDSFAPVYPTAMTNFYSALSRIMFKKEYSYAKDPVSGHLVEQPADPNASVPLPTEQEFSRFDTAAMGLASAGIVTDTDTVQDYKIDELTSHIVFLEQQVYRLQQQLRQTKGNQSKSFYEQSAKKDAKDSATKSFFED